MINCSEGNKNNVAKSTNDATILGKLQYPYDFQYEGNPLSRMQLSIRMGRKGYHLQHNSHERFYFSNWYMRSNTRHPVYA